MQIHWVGGDAFPEAEREAVEARIRELTEGYTDVIDVRITARTNGHHRHGGNEVRITCEARGKELVAARTRPDAGLALNEAVDVFERELRRLRDRRGAQGELRARGAETPETGVIDALSPAGDHGFILTSAGERVYFHRNALHGALEFEKLEEGQRVGLNIEGGEKGLQATVVRPPPPGTT
jgi:ribosome-associated translation inhibitor RaiA/cold shock CspA family protein